jgi:nucleoid-associated protein YgaU
MAPTKVLIRVLAVLLAASAGFAEETPEAVAAAAPEAVAVEPIEGSPEAPADPAQMDPGVEEMAAPVPTSDPIAAEAAPAEPIAAEAMPASAAEAEAPAAEAPATALEPDPASADLAAEAPVAPVSPEAVPATEPLDTHPPLGAIGYDSEGRRGRIHIVVGGDTLWDISDAYLGTPWVWPSIWRDNEDIPNPHLIHPGDHIWITPSEMRRISAEEAAALLANVPSEPAATEDVVLDTPEPEARELPQAVAEPAERGTYRVSAREMAGLITPDQLDASASIVGRVPERTLLTQEDDIYIGLGESDVAVGDQFTVFRTHEKVFDPDSGVLLGYHVEFLGWVEVKETFPETARANIRMSASEVAEGDRLIPREPLPAEIALQASPADVEGKISFFPQQRVVIGYNDFVYLNRGSVDGLEVGSPLDVYRPGYSADEQVRGHKVLVPDHVIGRLIVVRIEEESAVAAVVKAQTELALGDRFRGASQ